MKQANTFSCLSCISWFCNYLIIQTMQNEKLQSDRRALGQLKPPPFPWFVREPRTRLSVSGVRVRPEGPEKPGDALRARSKMRGGRLFRIGASRLTRTPASVVRAEGANHPNGLMATMPRYIVSQSDRRALGQLKPPPFPWFVREPRTRLSVSGVRVRPEGPEKPGDALRARSKMRGGRLFRIGASRLTRTPASVVRAEGANHPNGLMATMPRYICPASKNLI